MKTKKPEKAAKPRCGYKTWVSSRPCSSYAIGEFDYKTEAFTPKPCRGHLCKRHAMRLGVYLPPNAQTFHIVVVEDSYSSEPAPPKLVHHKVIGVQRDATIHAVRPMRPSVFRFNTTTAADNVALTLALALDKLRDQTLDEIDGLRAEIEEKIKIAAEIDRVAMGGGVVEEADE